MNWRGLVTIALLIGALISGWSVWRQSHKRTGPTAPVARSDYVLEDFELVALNKQGKESFTLRAPRLVRDPNQKTMDIATPVFQIPPSENSTSDAWQVRANAGWVSADANELRLHGAVKGTSAGVSGPPTTLTSDEMNVYPEDKRATAPGKVVINRPGSILSGHGLQLNLANKRYSFKSEVHHHYVPTQR